MVPISALVWWMAWKFLFGDDDDDDDDDDDEDFQPTIKSFGEGRRQRVGYYDQVDHGDTREVTDGFLQRAYEAQRSIPLVPVPSPIIRPTQAVTMLPAGEERALAGERQRSDQQPLNRQQSDVPEHPQCQTIARFEYMSQSHYGFISWFSYPMIILILMITATIHSMAVLVLRYEDGQYRFRNPQSTLNRGLYFQLGNCLLCLYILKHRWRASLFEHFYISLPRPWVKKTSIFPSYRGSKNTFINEETGDITTFDPTQRVLSSSSFPFPPQGHRGPSSTAAREYIAAYNANPGTCTTLYGHSGREMKSQLRYLPTICRIGFLLVACGMVLKGYLHVRRYRPPVLDIEKIAHPDLTVDDMEILTRIRVMGEILRYSQIFFAHPFVSVVPFLIGANMYLFFAAAWRHASTDTKRDIIKVLKPGLVEGLFGLEQEGRIRLD
ncbi:hypothetical protein GGS20DRAFT_543575 [Poronia punctata]|nr:hypothetical protein GGS20DRAFT_543575 [Poronia punctata]